MLVNITLTLPLLASLDAYLRLKETKCHTLHHELVKLFDPNQSTHQSSTQWHASFR